MSDLRQYTVGWICAIPTEYIAACLFLDEEHTPPDHVSANDKNQYTLGKMSGHNIVIALISDGEYEYGSATAAAKGMIGSFPDVRVCLLVGIGGGAPTAEHDVRLGDIVVGIQHGKTGGVCHYDYGKTIQNRSFQRTWFFEHPPTVVRSAVSGLESKYNRYGHQIEANIRALLDTWPRLRPDFSRPSQESDRLYKPGIVHPQSSEAACEVVCGSQTTALVLRSEREKGKDNPAIHYGVIASADHLMEDAMLRDIIAKEEGVLCFEMEAAGLTNHFPCLIVRGICDYSDSHKNAEWQGYAAMSATAYTKDLLSTMVSSQIEQQERIREVNETERLRRIFEWLSPPDPSTDYTKALKTRHDGTGLWFIQGDVFKEWKRRPSSFLWLHGMAGCGKTVLTSTIIARLEQDMVHHDLTHQVLLYFYFDFKDIGKQSLNSMLRSLVKQLCKERPHASRFLHHLWASHDQGSREPSTKSLQGALQSMLSGVSNVSIVLDALDESTTRNELLAWLKTLVRSKANNCRLLVTSRREKDIELALQSWTSAEERITIQQNEVEEDLAAYINDRVRNGGELERWRRMPEVQREIELHLLEKANGT
jgi:nucleoside phosphorylase